MHQPHSTPQAGHARHREKGARLPEEGREKHLPRNPHGHRVAPQPVTIAPAPPRARGQPCPARGRPGREHALKVHCCCTAIALLLHGHRGPQPVK